MHKSNRGGWKSNNGEEGEKRGEKEEKERRKRKRIEKTKETARGKTFRHGQRRERMISTMRSPAREMISPVSSNLTVRIAVKPIRVALNIYDAVRRSLIARHGDHRANKFPIVSSRKEGRKRGEGLIDASLIGSSSRVNSEIIDLSHAWLSWKSSNHLEEVDSWRWKDIFSSSSSSPPSFRVRLNANEREIMMRNYLWKDWKENCEREIFAKIDKKFKWELNKCWSTREFDNSKNFLKVIL